MLQERSAQFRYPLERDLPATAAWFLNALHFFRRNHGPESRPEFGCYSPQASPTPVYSPGLSLSFI